MADNNVQAVKQLSTAPGPDHDWSITLKEKVIAITGANQGIGLAIAETCLVHNAAHIISLDIGHPTQPFHDLVSQYPGRLEFVHCDVRSEQAVSSVLESIVAQKGRLDGMVANAGTTRHAAALDFSLDQVRELFELNVFGAWNCATAAARIFIRLGCRGSIVFTASMTSYRPNRAAPSAPYGATKAALRNMAHTLAMEWAQHGIRVNSISPGLVKTALTYYVDTSPDWDQRMKYYGGMPRLALPRELGGAYVYLLSEAATYTTGIDIPVAGIVGAW